jgi:hypothetical protein
VSVSASRRNGAPYITLSLLHNASEEGIERVLELTRSKEGQVPRKCRQIYRVPRTCSIDSVPRYGSRGGATSELNVGASIEILGALCDVQTRDDSFARSCVAMHYVEAPIHDPAGSRVGMPPKWPVRTAHISISLERGMN